ncbi:helix-turn-helix transcriptional regulator [Nocardioides sp. GY 10113]|uniref:winged helix-turn-helix transcriptional regulator n=1 Tax=Nocardioides sp. GY 10113 TaxID=2569761 RepID=UPI0010A8BC61|nr:helix-turn-helix domain-containing protein [Nocardioides sp. GY 10113]TIC80684.1 helix-turn-helix transcriptional regulator [Nocardioides sp. GY 10113]
MSGGSGDDDGHGLPPTLGGVVPRGCCPSFERWPVRNTSRWKTLRRLERDGLVTRTVYAQVPPRVDYELTPLGRSLRTPMEALEAWAIENIPAVLEARESYDRRP